MPSQTYASCRPMGGWNSGSGTDMRIQVQHHSRAWLKDPPGPVPLSMQRALSGAGVCAADALHHCLARSSMAALLSGWSAATLNSSGLRSWSGERLQ